MTHELASWGASASGEADEFIGWLVPGGRYQNLRNTILVDEMSNGGWLVIEQKYKVSSLFRLFFKKKNSSGSKQMDKDFGRHNSHFGPSTLL